MILHLLVPFRTHFKLYDEELIYHPDDYTLFWNQAKKEIQNKNYGFKNISLLHASPSQKKTLSRFRTIDHNSLERPIEIISLTGKPDDEEIKQLFKNLKNHLLGQFQLAEEVELISESLVIKIFNNSVGILELDIKIKHLFNNEHTVNTNLDLLQEFGVTLGEDLSQFIYKAKVEPFLRDLLTFSNSSQFIITELFEFETAKTNKILVPESTPDNYLIKVNWVTRSLLFETENEYHASRIINHWLKDSGDDKMIEDVLNQPNKCAYRWLNYLFRESSYSRSLNSDGTIDYTTPFCDEWEAMLISQYYYNAFEALNDSLDITLAAAFLNYRKTNRKNRHKLKSVNRKLSREIIDAHELLINYENNFAYYKRSISDLMKIIMAGWDFENSIVNQVKNKVELCEQRMEILHQKATEKANLYTDLLLLGIAVVSIIAFMFQVIEYGRNISQDANLAVYESNSFNFVNVLSERPTDFAISISLGLMIIIFFVYYIFRRDKVLD